MKNLIINAREVEHENRMEVLLEVEKELTKAQDTLEDLYSPREGYAFIMEEVDKMWTEIKRQKPDKGNEKKIQKGAIQVATMAVRLIMDTLYPHTLSRGTKAKGR